MGKRKNEKKRVPKVKHVNASLPLVSQSIQTLNVMDNCVQTMDVNDAMNSDSIRQSIHSMASHNEEADTVNISNNILSASQNNFCDNVLSNLFANENTSPSKCLEILRSIDVQNGDGFDYFKRTNVAKEVLDDIIQQAMDVCDDGKENKSPISIPKIKFEKNMNLQLMVEDLINEQNIKREIIQDEDS